MPRNLEDEKAILDGMAPLTKEPNNVASPLSLDDDDDNYNFDNENEDDNDPGDKLMNDMKKGNKRDCLHVYPQILTLADIESCVKLEEATLPPHERCTREKFHYRLTKCNELTLGLYTSVSLPPDPPSTSTSTSTSSPNPLTTAPTFPPSRPADSTTPTRHQLLLAHAVATKSRSQTITDDDMALPPHWRANNPNPNHNADPHLGHKEDGRTLALHSVAVLPQCQRRGLGRTLVRAFVQRVEASGVADRVALLAHEGLVGWYEGLGFVNRGRSAVGFGGGGWFDMVLEFKKPQNRPA